MKYDVRAISADYRAKHGGFEATEVHLVRNAAPARVTVVGEIRTILYTTRKAFEGKETLLFYHDFEGKNKPFYAAGEGGHFILGGGYEVTNHGIEDDPADTRTIPHATFTADLRAPAKMAGMGKMHSLKLVGGKTVSIKGHILGYTKNRLFIVPECNTSACKWGLR